MEQIIIKRGSPIVIPVQFKRTQVINNTMNKADLEELLNTEFTQQIDLKKPAVLEQ